MMAFLLGQCSDLTIRERIGVPVGIVVFLLFVIIGIDAALHPKRHMNSYLRRGAEMLTDLNLMGVQLSGLVFAIVSGWILYELVKSVWLRCFA